MFLIYDGRDHFWQWDFDQKMIVEDPSIERVHFCNRTGDCSLTCRTYEQNGQTLVDVPNQVLKQSYQLHVYAYQTDHTKVEEVFQIVRRTRPEEYVDNPTDTLNFYTLAAEMGDLNDLITDDKSSLVAAINEVAENGGGGGGTVDAYTKAESDARFAPIVHTHDEYATAAEVDEKIGAINIPTKTSDLENDSDYATKTYVDEAVAGGGGEVPTKISELENDVDFKPFLLVNFTGSDPTNIVADKTTAEICEAFDNGYIILANYSIYKFVHLESLGASYATFNFLSGTFTFKLTLRSSGAVESVGPFTLQQVENKVNEITTENSASTTLYPSIKAVCDYVGSGGGGGGTIEQVQADWNQADNTQVDYIKNKPTIPTVPSNVSAFTNDAGYQTAAEVQALINASIPPSGEEVSY